MKSEVKLNTIQEKPRTYPCLVKGGLGCVWLAFNNKEGVCVGHYSDVEYLAAVGTQDDDLKANELPLFEGSITLTND